MEQKDTKKTKTVSKVIEKYDKNGNYIGKDIVYEEIPIEEENQNENLNKDKKDFLFS